MDKLRKLFGEYELSWKRLIVFSIVCGVYTAAVLLIPGIKDSALHEIGVFYEMWFILAIFVISNCHSIKEASLKCFVFFLISQPLVYILQMPFVDKDFGMWLYYYKPWFIKTLLTLPGAAIAYLIKRDDLFGSLVLSVAGGFVSFMAVYYMLSNLSPFRIDYILYGIFLIASVIAFGLIFCSKKRDRVLYYVISFVIGIAIALKAVGIY